jgi:hypothetical protein
MSALVFPVLTALSLLSNANILPASAIEHITPLVLDLENVQRFEGTNITSSKIRFDHLGDGIRRLTGWPKPSMGFLAIDHNGNGRIDNGSELLGQGTTLHNGQKSRNGFIALKELDQNDDGMIDSRDAAYAKLLLWVDLDSNGITDADELRPLSDYGITKLSAVWEPSLRHPIPVSVFENEARFESRYWGPEKCGEKGCLVFDVFFSTAVEGGISVAVPPKIQ